MNIAIIGPGRVGTVLALALPQSGHRVVAVVGGSEATRARFRSRVAGTRFTELEEACLRAEMLVIATGDDVVATVARQLAAEDLVGPPHRVVHLAGSLGLEVLRPVALTGAAVAAVHPAQSIPHDAAADALVGAAWGVTASDEDLLWVRRLVTDLGGEAHEVRDVDRQLYHAALTLGSGAVAAAASAARQLLLAAGIEAPAAFLAGLAGRSLDNVLRDGAAALTGPVVRGDADTLACHLEAIDRDLPELAGAYRHLQRAVVAQAAAGLDEATVAALLAALHDR